MWLYSRAFRAMFPLVTSVAVQVNAEAECPSLLALTARSTEDRIPFSNNECKGQGLELFRKKKVQDNALTFDVLGNQTIYLSALSFQGLWYTVSAGQPVDLKCLTITDSTTLHFKAGRHRTGGVADIFMEGNTATSVTSATTGPTIYDDDVPHKLNFAFEGTATLEFSDAISGVVFSSSLAIRMGQGHKAGENNWWIGHDECTGG